MANDWHLVHLGALARGGSALVFTEATAVEPCGRTAAVDLGLWDDRQIEPLQAVSRFIRRQGAVPGIQLAHAGRKAATVLSTMVERPGDRWTPVGPSPLAFGDKPVPSELDRDGIGRVVQAFSHATRRARDAGFEVVEIHAAHGYLVHQFLSPVSNRRTDAYGGSFQGRCRLLLEVVDAVRSVWPDDHPVFVRVSATDWVPSGGWDIDQSVELARLLGGASQNCGARQHPFFPISAHPA